MQDIIAGVEKIRFDIEVDVVNQRGTLPLPFPGMDKSGSAVCDFFSKGHCKKGAVCSFRHLHGEKSVVCKHWLRGLCKKGDQCEFLHEYDMTRMPECYFYSKFNECSNKECPFLHIDPACKVKDCPWYDRGFCKHGPLCKHRHTRRVMCPQYLVGFCPEGANFPKLSCQLALIQQRLLFPLQINLLKLSQQTQLHSSCARTWFFRRYHTLICLVLVLSIASKGICRRPLHPHRGL
ncbi:cleavage and polyadenylation specificity factor subunit 4-like isoform X3 [Polypterus senegalus]|uniref:cleavage and polyadenylation specificity factor subunit 4-like isoform X3 n=1 Tax=Polypterus senegalus TaxID=55291 RepID=UPI00196583C9|nr:cleavage and polyadenylation specificity factor subunit 4-like isoform X3 [Polypterus senegalus]